MNALFSRHPEPAIGLTRKARSIEIGMKIYTRTGDKGETSLFGGDRVTKFHPLIAAYGTVDETNATIGLARAHLAGDETLNPLDEILSRIQNELFIVGADLATPLESRAQVPRIDDAHVAGLESDIDQLDAENPELRQFVLPGGHAAAAALHLARTVCRRAERETVEALQLHALEAGVPVYLNRLSDLLFVAARWVNQRSGIGDTPWQP